ncbi:MAG TPA: ankyrin repeat domain-containing protein [Bryobacteraceae bacterium]|nr:ankyrin repeat domain-containing protein [Bryobacteraceae bacterium]
MRSPRFLFSAALTISAASFCPGAVSYIKDVKPILQARCYSCHGPLQQMGSLRLDRKERALIDGRGEPAIVPGNSAQSQLYRRISGARLGPQMPLTGTLGAREIAVLKEWIDSGASWPDEPPPRHDWTADIRLNPLFSEMRAGLYASVRAAVQTDPGILRARREDGTTLLMQATLYADARDVDWLIGKGANPNLANAAGVTALMWATGDVEKTRALLTAGARANARSDDGQTALIIACEEAADPEVVKLLLDHGAHATADQGIDPLVLAARNADPKSMALLAEKRGGKFPAGALTGAALSDCLQCVRLILDGGYANDAISVALNDAATTASIELMQTLLAAGADVNWKDGVGATSLMHAAYSDYAETDRVKLLLDHGAATNLRDAKGDTALRIAKRKGGTGVVALLSRSGGKD